MKTIYTISDVDVVERSRFDMSFKYFLEMAPEQGVINASTLTKFRKLRLKDTDLLHILTGKTVSIAIYKGIIRSKSIIVDATHSVSRLNPFSAVQVLKERLKLLRKAVYIVDKFDYNKDADRFVCSAGHLAIRKAKQGKTNVGGNQVHTYYFEVQKCKVCPLKEGCYKSGLKTKTYSVSIKSDLHQE